MYRLITLVLLLSAAVASAADIASVAAMTDPAQVAAALKDEDPRVRGVAARVAAARRMPSLLATLRAVLREESDVEAAAEEAQAIGMLGGSGQVDFLAGQSERFNGVLDEIALASIGRSEGPKAIDLWFDGLRAKREWSQGAVARFVSAAFWDQEDAVDATAAKALEIPDDRVWQALMPVVSTARALEGLRSRSEPIAKATAWHFASVEGASKPAAEDVAAALGEARKNFEAPSDELQVAWEILGRSVGLERGKVTVEQFQRVNEAHALCSAPLRTQLSREEAAAVCGRKLSHFGPRGVTLPVTRPPFNLLVDLPRGLANDVVTAARCKDDIIGNVKAAANRDGTIEAFDTKDVETTPACRKALDILIPLSIVTPESIFSARSSAALLLVKSRRVPFCERERGEVAAREPVTMGGEVKAPQVIERTEPEFSSGARRLLGSGATTIVIESVITTEGCVSALRALSGAPVGDINRSALLAVSQWRFKPGTIDGKPVPVIFNVTITYRMP